MVDETKFGTAINCMDGRVQTPVADWLKSQYKVDYVDVITEPGPNRVLTTGNSTEIESIRSRVAISVEKHGSRVVALVCHEDCAGNPVPREENIAQTREGTDIVRSWGFPVEVIGLWVGGPSWTVELL